MQKKMIPIRGMHCRSCELLLEESVGEIRGVKSVKADFRKSQIAIEYGDDIPSEKEIALAVKKSGYEVGAEDARSWITKSAEDWRYILFGAALLTVLYYALKGSGILNIALVENEVTYGFALLLGLIAGISTCMALIGGLVLGISAEHAKVHPEATPWQKFRPHLFFNGGRVFGYALFGGLLGILGGVLQLSSAVLAFLMIAVGVVMIALGIKLTNISPRLSAVPFTLPPSLARVFGIAKHQKEYSHRAAMITGALTFFLPCGFTQAMQIYAISTGDFKTGALIMGAFALGTVPALLGIGGISSIMKGAAARLFYAVVGILVIVFGVYNIQSAVNTLPALGAVRATEGTENVPQKGDVQTLLMTQNAGGYEPNTLRVKAGTPVEWVITSESSFTCASSLSVPSLGIRANLKKGKNVFTFTPTQKGTIPFSCSMGMYRGTIIVE